MYHESMIGKATDCTKFWILWKTFWILDFDDSCYYLSFLCWVLFIYVLQYFLGWLLTKLTSSHHLQEYYSLLRSIYGSFYKKRCS